MSKIQLVVLNEHTLGYMDEGANRLNTLQALVGKGASFTRRNGDMVFLSPGDTVRLANEADFTEYGISSEGYRTDTRYEYDRG